MAFCNSCGAQLAEGTKFCSKCGAAVAGTPVAAQPIAPGPPPSQGSNSALKIILVIVGIIVLLGILGMVTCGIVIHRFAKNSRLSQKGDNVKVETPFGSIEGSSDPQKVADELGIDIYPGAQVQKNGTVSVTFGSLHSVTAIFESNDAVDKVCDFYRSKFPGASVTSSDQNQCTIIAGDRGNQTNISVQPSGDGSRFTIVKVSKKS
jgi:hypothetical protein